MLLQSIEISVRDNVGLPGEITYESLEKAVEKIVQEGFGTLLRASNYREPSIFFISAKEIFLLEDNWRLKRYHGEVIAALHRFMKTHPLPPDVERYKFILDGEYWLP